VLELPSTTEEARMADRPTHFEVPVDDPDRAEKFYADAFGWTFNRFEGAPQYYGLATTGEDADLGINGALYQRGDMNQVTLTMSVDSIEEAGARIAAAGGELVADKVPIPNIGYFAMYKDTESNVLGIFVADTSATM
jgi:predicted enzyme related to lactoylglutathione lyase